jgi:hypothetical protein
LARLESFLLAQCPLTHWHAYPYRTDLETIQKGTHHTDTFSENSISLNFSPKAPLEFLESDYQELTENWRSTQHTWR